jgi:hypothetical protein
VRFRIGPLLVILLLPVSGMPATMRSFTPSTAPAYTTPTTSSLLPMHLTTFGDRRTFPETGMTVSGIFLDYWLEHGGLTQHGYPLSESLTELSNLDGKPYTVQYFERAVFEHHPENQPPFDVLLAQLGTFQYKQKYLSGAPNQRPNMLPDSVLFPQTGKRLGGRFLEYWQRNGGLMQQGYPISDEFYERSRLDGKVYMVQYFERAVFELHPENQPPFDVLLSQLGAFRHNYKTYRQLPADCRTIYSRKGLLISQGANTELTRPYGLKSYRLEEVMWPGPITCEVEVPGKVVGVFEKQTLTFDQVWRLTITTVRPLYQGQYSWYVWLDDKLIGGGRPSYDVGELRTVVFDRALLQEGAAVGVSHGPVSHPQDTLPERLQLATQP